MATSGKGIAPVLSALMDRRGLSTYALSSMSGVSHSTIHRIATGETSNPSSKNVNAIADALGITTAQLEGREPLPEAGNTASGPNITHWVPLISSVQAGLWAEVIDNLHPGDHEDMVPTTRKVGPRAFALKLSGDSMVSPNGGISFAEGEVIICDPDKDYGPGSYVVAKLDSSNEATFKRLVSDGVSLYLKPLNPAYRQIEVTDEVRIIGPAVQKVQDL